jgi:tetratricopeptide (TPR) repeat protein
MITDPFVSASDNRGQGDGRANHGLDPHAIRRASPVRTILLTGLTLGGIAFSIWWYWSARRPVPDLPVIETWIRNQQYDSARKALRDRLRRTPYDGAVRIMLARVLAAGGDLAGCTQELRQIPPWSPRKAEALYREGQIHLMRNRARDAEASLCAIIDDVPSHQADAAVYHDASQELLALYATEDRWEDAKVILWKIYHRLGPSYRPTVLALRVLSELERIAPSESVKRLRPYVTADPADWEARRALAKAELALGQHAEAFQDMRDCLDARPNDPRTWRDYLTMLQSLGERETLDAVLARVPTIAETLPDPWIFRAQAAERVGDWAAAAAHYRRALEIKPNLLNAHYRLATIENRLKRPVQAAAHRKRWKELNEARGELRQAFDAYFDAQQRLSNDSPELLAALKRLASICQTLGWYRTAAGWGELAVP